MELFCLLCVEDVQALLTNELIVDVWMLLVDVTSECILTVEVGAGTVQADELLVVALCQVIDQSADVVDICVMTSLLKLVVQDVDNLCSSVLPNIQRRDHALLIICCWCVYVEMDERVLFLKLLKVLFCWLHGHLKRAVDEDSLFSDKPL